MPHPINPRRRIRKVDANGTLTTVAGHGGAAPPGADGDAATAVAVNSVYSLLLDGDNLLYTDISASSVGLLRRVHLPTGKVYTLASGLSFPMGLAQDSNTRNIYIAETGMNRISMRAASTGAITIVAGSGESGFDGDLPRLATAARLDGPMGVAVDSAGRLYIADAMNRRIRRVDAAGTMSTYIGPTTTTTVLARTPPGMVLDVVVASSGSVFLTDVGNTEASTFVRQVVCT